MGKKYKNRIGEEDFLDFGSRVSTCHHEVRCYKPNTDGKLVLTKILNVKHHDTLEYQQNYDVYAGNGIRKSRHYYCKFPTSPTTQCRKRFSSKALTVLYCYQCRIKNARIIRRKSLAKAKERKRINDNI